MAIFPGQRVRITATFTVNGTATDPTAGNLKYKDPNGNVTSVPLGSLTNSSTGVYFYDLTLTTAGTWFFRIEATATVITAQEASIVVDVSNFS